MGKAENTKAMNSVFSAVLGLHEEELNDELGPDMVDSWDSFNGLVITSELETKFDIRFTTEEVTSIKCLGDLKQILRDRGIDL